MISSLRIGALILCLSSPFAHGASKIDPLQRVALGVETLQNWYDWQTGLWHTTGWWGAANSMTVLVNYSRLANSTQYLSAVDNTFVVNAPGHFLDGRHYDDEGWWALAWVDAYDWTQNDDYLDMARFIFADLLNAWDDHCGGGVWWGRDNTYKNAITNELFLSLAAHLANRVKDPDQQAQYLEWAVREWEWFAQSGMINSDNLINDGLTFQCENNHQTTWTYNQGVVLGGLAELYQQCPDSSLLEAARAIASATMSLLTDESSILHEPCEPDCNRDRTQFKGIFVRNLMALHDVSPDAQYVDFITANAESIWSEDQGPSYQFGLVWSGPFDTADATRETSALDALIAAAALAPGQ